MVVCRLAIICSDNFCLFPLGTVRLSRCERWKKTKCRNTICRRRLNYLTTNIKPMSHISFIFNWVSNWGVEQPQERASGAFHVVWQMGKWHKIKQKTQFTIIQIINYESVFIYIRTYTIQLSLVYTWGIMYNTLTIIEA